MRDKFLSGRQQLTSGHGHLDLHNGDEIEPITGSRAEAAQQRHHCPSHKKVEVCSYGTCTEHAIR